MKLIVGLGNPGSDYESTRHNIGWDVLDAFGWSSPEKKFNGLLCKKGDVWLFKPTTFMNSSGDAVAARAGMHKLTPADIIVVHDDMDIPLGDVRVKKTGGHGGHRGVKSVIERLGSPDFVRVKCGIGRPAEGVDVLKHVLSRFSKEETAQVQKMTAQAVAVLLGLLPKDDPEASHEDEKSTS